MTKAIAPRGDPPAGAGRPPGWAEFGCGQRGCGLGGGGRGRGRGRVFDNGDLRPLVLHLLSERPRHGYEIIKALEERVGGGYSPSPGVVYPTLTMLEDLGQAAVSEARAGRKLYALTAEGEAALAAQRPVLEAILARLASDSAARGSPPPQILRAMENLATAVRLRLQSEPASEHAVRAIAALLDATARGVEEVR